MFENWDTKNVLIGLAVMLISKFLIPRLFGNQVPTADKSLQIRDKQEPTELESSDSNLKNTTLSMYRPYMPVFFMARGITKIYINDFIKIEPTYTESMAIRAQDAEKMCVVARTPDASVKVEQATNAAVTELYDYVMGYMCQRFPAIFVRAGKTVINRALNLSSPRSGSKLPAEELLIKLRQNIDDDLLLLQLDQESGEYIVRATTCSGSDCLNKPYIDTTDTGLPQYIQKQNISFRAQISAIKAKAFMQKLTWGIEGSAVPENAKLIVEREVATRLSKTGYVVIAKRQYQYTLKQVAAEGNAGELSSSIKGWPADMAAYKGRDTWGTEVLQYLDKNSVDKSNAKSRGPLLRIEKEN